ncbi:MAG: mechanosensitive ion channel protein MscS, partial [Methylococcales bacterium]
MIKPNYSITHSRLSSLVFLLLIVFCNPVNASAKTAVSTNIQNSALIEITAKTLEAKIESINSRKGLDDTLKSKVLSIYQSAQDNLSSNESYKAKTELFNQAIKTAPETIKQRLKDIDQLLTKIGKQKLEDFNRISTDELIQREILEKRRASSLDDQLKKLDNELNLQQSRPQLIREEMVIAKQDIEVTQKKISAPANKAISKLEAEATLINLKTLIDSRSAELHMLDIEAMSNPARVELLKADYKFLDLQKNAIVPIINAIEDLLTERREQDAKNIQDALSQAEKELSGKHLTIQTITRENIQYTRDLQAINVKIENYTDQKARIDAEANQIDEDFKSAQRKISLAGLSPELGKVLREQRRSLANQDQLSQQTEVIQNETASSSLEEFKVEDKIKQLSDIDAYLRQIMDQQVDKKLPNEARMMIQAELRVLLNNQKELLNKLVFDYTTFLKTLGDFDFSRQQMLTHANKFAIYLDENLLWVKSSDPINWDTLGNLLSSVEWLLSPSNWLGLIKDASKIILFNPLFLFIGTLLSIGLLIGSNWAKQHLSDIFDSTNREYSENFFHTLQALTYTLIVILPIPFISYYFGWVLNKNIHVADFSRAIGEGLKTASISLLFLQFFYHLFSMNGIAYKYFQWQKSNISLLRKQIHWLRFVAVITTFIITSTSTSKYSIYSDNLGRLGFILSMIAMAVFWGKLLNPTTGLVKTHIKVDQKSWITQLRYVWYPAIYGVPLILVGFAIAGYYLSALQLQGQIISSMRIIFLAAFIHEIVVHWLTLVNRQLAIKNAIQKRKAQEIIEKQLPSGGEDPVLHLTEELIDIPKINAQTTRLLNLFVSLSLIIGFWVIWKNILPAFSFLDNYVLWQHLVIVDDQKSYEPVTLSHLMIAGLYLFIA